MAFRFFDARYDKKYFIDDTGKAFPTFEQTTAFGREVYHTKIISNYEDYRNILYGNNKGLPNEFRKYALLESRQYQNIPRTIQNVFLNSKLDAAFIKETIIKSLSEEEIKIDLSTYAHNHLRNFETELNDIKIWSQKNKSGKIIVRTQAEAVASSSRDYSFVQEEKKIYSRKLGWFVKNIEVTRPALEESLKNATIAETKAKERLNNLENSFSKKQKHLQTEIGIISSQLRDLKEKRRTYEAGNIEAVLSRVEKKQKVDLVKQNLQEERHLLTSKFEAIEQQYYARITQLETQLDKFKNTITEERLQYRENFGSFKETQQEKYESLITEIEKQHGEAISLAKEEIRVKETSLYALNVKEAEIKHKPFFEAETKAREQEKKEMEQQISTAESIIENSGKERDYLKKEWELEIAQVENNFRPVLEDVAKALEETNKKIQDIQSRTDETKGSFYEWLNEHIPDWQASIGKVVDEENVLFSKDLHPQLMKANTNSFYGIQLNLDAIDKQVKTLADYEGDIQKLSEEANKLQVSKEKAIENLEKEKQNLKKKFRPRIKALKEAISTSTYQKEQFSQKLTKTENSIHDLEQKAAEKRSEALEDLQNDRKKLDEEKLEATEGLDKLVARVKREISAKNREKKELLLEEENKLKSLLKDLEIQLKEKEKEIAKQTREIRDQERSQLKLQGADTGRIEEIDKRLSDTEKELEFLIPILRLLLNIKKTSGNYSIRSRTLEVNVL